MNKYLEEIKDCVVTALAEEDVAIALFGSMASGESHAGSGVDIALVPRGKWDRSKLTLLRERLEEMNTPYQVELVDFSEVSDDFRRVALAHSFWWKR
jgi:predicted nucleotidyltransferase